MHPACPKIAIIILNWNGLKDTIACIDSVSALDYPNFEIILVDNGSIDDTVRIIGERNPQVHCIALPRNLGFAGGNNVGIEYALKNGCELIVLLNNDTIIAPDLLHRFVEGFTKEPQAGILGARIYLFDAKDTLDHLGGIWMKKEAKMHLVGLREKDTLPLPEALIPLDYVCGACMIIKRSVFEAIGLLEPRYFLYWEENDFCLRAKRAGFLCFSSPHAHIWHKVSASIVGGRPHAIYFVWRGRLLWIERNYRSWERSGIYCRVILPAFFKLVKLKLLKSMQLCLYRLFRPHTDHSGREKKLLNYSAALAGIRDYMLRRFDQGPSWIYTKK